MNELTQTLNFSGITIRTVVRATEVWFVLADVCTALGIANSRDVFRRLDNDEKGVDFADTLGGKQQMQVVNEFGLYNVILRSNSDKAKPFRRWVTHEVLPSIRQKGFYSVLTDEQLLNVLIQRQIDSPDFANKISRTSLRSEAIKTARPDRQEKCDELFNSHYMAELDKGEYALMLQEICKDDSKLYEGEMKRYSERVELLNMARVGLKKMLRKSRRAKIQ